MCVCVWAFNYLKMACQSVEEFDLKISESLPARPSLALKACDNAAGQSCCHKVFGGVACAPHASLSSPMTGVRMPIWAALIEFSKLYTRLCVYLSLSLSLCISLYLRFLCLSRSALNFRLTACWARCRKLSRCHCNTHLIRLVARLHWWFIVLLPTAFAPLLILPLFLLFLPLLLQAACRANPKQVVSLHLHPRSRRRRCRRCRRRRQTINVNGSW